VQPKYKNTHRRVSGLIIPAVALVCLGFVYRCPRVAKKLHNLFVFIKDINFFFFLDDSYASTAYSENIAVYIQVSQYYKNTKVMFF
jgi:hypothetical protein